MTQSPCSLATVEVFSSPLVPGLFKIWLSFPDNVFIENSWQVKVQIRNKTRNKNQHGDVEKLARTNHGLDVPVGL